MRRLDEMQFTSLLGQHQRLASLWALTLVIPFLLGAFLAVLPFGDSADGAIAGVVQILGLLGFLVSIVGAGLLLYRSQLHGHVEDAYVGLFFATVAFVSALRVLAWPGLQLGDATMHEIAGQIAVPMALIVALPLLLGRGERGNAVDQQKNWLPRRLLLGFAVGAIIAGLRVVGVATEPFVEAVIVAISISACLVLASRHFVLATIARDELPLAVSAGFGLIAASSLFRWRVDSGMVTPAIGELLAVAGGIAGTVGMLLAYRHCARVHRLIDPILELDPRSALELGVEPIVHDYLDYLDEREPVEFAHVMRTQRLALAVARKLHLDTDAQRDVALTAIFHDVGMMFVPQRLLDETEELTEVEAQILRRHANYGADYVAESSLLGAIEFNVRAHQERLNGSGYPTGLHDNQIPLAARIVSACCAYDAMAHHRLFRRDAHGENILGVLERNAGEIWDRRVVNTIVRGARFQPPSEMPAHLLTATPIGCDCLPTPEDAFGATASLYSA